MKEKSSRIKVLSRLLIQAGSSGIQNLYVFTPNSFHCICRHCRYIQSNYNADSNTKTSNYSKVRIKPLI